MLVRSRSESRSNWVSNSWLELGCTAFPLAVLLAEKDTVEVREDLVVVHALDEVVACVGHTVVGCPDDAEL